MKNLKSIFKGKNLEVFKLVMPTNTEKRNYVVDTYLDDMYVCVPDNNYVLARTCDAEGLRHIVESDDVNEYKFTKEAYSRCEEYFSDIAI